MPANVLVIVVDGLRASALGAYGNTSYSTPALDRLAAESLLLDCCFAPSPNLPDIYRTLWNSSSSDQQPQISSLPHQLSNAGYSTTLVSDEPSLSALATVAEVDTIVQIASASNPESRSARAVDASETALAQAFSAATEQVVDAGTDKPRLVWLHTRGLYGPWDAPLALQQSLLDDEDPSPIPTTAPPDFFIDRTHDPDTAFRYASAYASQVMVLDDCVENLLAALPGSEKNNWLTILLGARGFSLGEHGRVGGVDSRTYAEQLHVPWLIRFPDKRGQLTRSNALTSHHDLLPTLLDLIGHESLPAKPEGSAVGGMSVVPLATNARASWRSAVISKSESARSVRTAGWCLREPLAPRQDGEHAAATDGTELFVRPDDRWEANDVAKLCSEVVDELRAELPGC